METKIEELEYAKRAVVWLIEHPNGSVDFHGLVYWAQRVETLRKELREL